MVDEEVACSAAEEAADRALYRGEGEKLYKQVRYRDLDPARLWALGYSRAYELIKEGRVAPDNQAYLVVSARNAMYDALRKIYEIDYRGKNVTWEDEELHTFLRPTPEQSRHGRHGRYRFRLREETERERGLSQEGYRAANELLTPKERRIVDGVLEGKTQTEIAEELGHKQPWISKLFRRSIEKLNGAEIPELQQLGARLELLGRETRRHIR